MQRKDNERDRRLEPGEWGKILGVIATGVLPRTRRPLVLEGRRDKGALKCITVLAVETAMRMREMYTLRWSQVDLSQKTVVLDKTKNGDKRKPRFRRWHWRNCARSSQAMPTLLIGCSPSCKRRSHRKC